MLIRRMICIVFVTTFALFVATVPGQSADTPKPGGTMVYMSGKIPSLDPLHGQVNVGFVSSNIFASLTRLNSKNEVSPYLAKSWSISDDGLTLTFRLVENATFHDGKPITSEDVAFSIKIVQKYHRFGKQMFGPIKSMETPDAHTVVCRLSTPYSPILLAATTPRHLPIMPKHVYGEGGEYITHSAHKNPVGSGPYKIKELKVDEYLLLDRTKNHFVKGLPYLDRIIFRIVTDKTAMRVGLQRNQFNLANVTMTMRYAEIKSFQEIPHLNLTRIISPSGAAAILEFNNRKEPLNKKKVRQAIAHAIDNSHIANVLHYGWTKASVGPMPYTNIFFNKNLKGYVFDVEKANKLLDEAGYPRKENGIRFEVKVLYIAPPHEPDFQIVPAEYITAALKKVGIKVVLEPMPGAAAWSQRMADWNFDASITIPGDKIDPAIGISRLYICDNIEHQAYTNTSGYCNKKVDELFVQGARESNFEKRKAIYDEVQNLLVEEIPMLWLIDITSLVFHHKDLYFPSYGYGEFWDEVYWKKVQK
jgi:peptide/nickel transport system substrate-binding protein